MDADGGASLYGDAESMIGRTKGGNDNLKGGDGDDLLLGDASERFDFASGGNDVLNGGRGDDLLYGDSAIGDSSGATGADRFVFGRYSGADTIGDFETGKDRIDVRALGITSTAGFASFTDDGTDTVIEFSPGNQVTVLGVLTTEFTSLDFIFA